MTTPPLPNLANRRILITGASMGIGRMTAILAGQAGAKVGISYFNHPSQAKLVKQEIERLGGETILLPGDVSDFQAAQTITQQMLDHWQGIDVLINNAGIISWKPLLEEKINLLHRIIAVNLIGIINMTYAVAPIMKTGKLGGIIVNIASQAGKIAYPHLAVYSASKFGVIGFTKSVAQELYQDHIRVYAVCPGTTATQMTQNQGMPPEQVAQKILQIAGESLNLTPGDDLVIQT